MAIINIIMWNTSNTILISGIAGQPNKNEGNRVVPPVIGIPSCSVACSGREGGRREGGREGGGREGETSTHL